MKAEDIGLKDGQLEEIRAILAKNERVAEAVLYGSRAKGNYRPYSDIDLTLKGTDLNIHDVFELDTAFYETSLPYIIDLSIYETLQNKELIEHIDRVGVTVYTRSTTQI